VDTAIQSIYRDLEYAKSLIKGRGRKNVDDTLEDSEESWTFIGDDNDPELIRRIHDGETMARSQSQLGSYKNASSSSEASGGSRALGHEIQPSSTVA
jgi:sterol 3beta-glucosyltransferase